MEAQIFFQITKAILGGGEQCKKIPMLQAL